MVHCCSNLSFTSFADLDFNVKNHMNFANASTMVIIYRYILFLSVNQPMWEMWRVFKCLLSFCIRFWKSSACPSFLFTQHSLQILFLLSSLTQLSEILAVFEKCSRLWIFRRISRYISSSPTKIWFPFSNLQSEQFVIIYYVIFRRSIFN